MKETGIALLVIVTITLCTCGIITTCSYNVYRNDKLMMDNGYRWEPGKPAMNGTSGQWVKDSVEK